MVSFEPDMHQPDSISSPSNRMQPAPSPMAPEMNLKYDYIFCGNGASASLLLMAMSRNNLLRGARVLLIDPESKAARDKTFCFWSHREETISLELADIISHFWEKVELPDRSLISLSPLRYNHVSSLDLYREAARLAEVSGFEKLTAKVEYIDHDALGPFVQVNEVKIRGLRIFDSRPPSYKTGQASGHHLFQSFVGWMIDTEKNIPQEDAFRFMDFDVEQQGFTQFVYVLPFSKTSALVEVTRFGTEMIGEAEAGKILRNYIEKEFGAFDVSHVETGCIPMSNCKIEHDGKPGVTVLGARNYLIKPSTGYAFKNMFHHAREISLSILEGRKTEAFNRSHEQAFGGRFSFYDDLLLDILEKRPAQGKYIFSTLLKKVEIPLLLKFLDEKTGFREDCSIFYRLPWLPFLAACGRKAVKLRAFRPLLLCILTLLLLLPGSGSSVQWWIGYGLFFAGLATVGIPHGAVDHLLETGKWDFGKAPLFAAKYLLQAAGAGVLFYFLPTPALFLFIGYSAWHFGQADGKWWNFSPLLSLVWGASVLVYILGVHPEETQFIVTAMGAHLWPFTCPAPVILVWLIPGLMMRKTSLVFTVLWLFLSSQLPLLFAFGLYFIGQHSLTGWLHVKDHLKMSHKAIWLHALPFHAGAWLLLGLFRFFWPSAEMGTPWGLFFIFIACISLPHVLAMHAMYREAEKKIQAGT
jgi:lycopene beta-cyclase